MNTVLNALLCCLRSFIRSESHTASSVVFFFNDTATTEIYTLSLHDALPIYYSGPGTWKMAEPMNDSLPGSAYHSYETFGDRKSTRLNSSHQIISYSVFCLKKKNESVRPTPDYSSLCITNSVSETPARSCISM